MKRSKHVIALVLFVALVFSLPLSSYATSKKDVYVNTKFTVTSYEDHEESIIKASFKYDKNGLIKKSVVSDPDGLFKINTTYKYKGNKVKSNSRTLYVLGSKYAKGSTKYTLNKKGRLTGIKSYENGKAESSYKYKVNSKGRVTKETEYTKKGKVSRTLKYAYDDNGKLKSIKEYSAKGKLKSTQKYLRDSNTVIIETYNAKGELQKTRINTLDNGRLISYKEYDETQDHKLITKAKYTYKKISTTKKSVVNEQQDRLGDYL